jgi:hypothetical protein
MDLGDLTVGERARIFVHMPSVLLKAYRNPDHARQFVEEGLVRLGSIRSFRSIEASDRKDPTEGHLQLLVPGDVPRAFMNPTTGEVSGLHTAPGLFHYQGEFGNPVLLFCASSLRVSAHHLIRQYGPSVVLIHDPRAFLVALAESFTDDPPSGRRVTAIDVLRVRYNKGELGRHPHIKSIRPFVGQKSSRFARDHEWRVAAILDGPLFSGPDEHFARVKRPQSFCKLAAC